MLSQWALFRRGWIVEVFLQPPRRRPVEFGMEAFFGCAMRDSQLCLVACWCLACSFTMGLPLPYA